MDNLLIIFIKNIQLGKVKTRLAKTVGHEKAIEIYRSILNRTNKEALKANCDYCVFYSSFIEENDIWENNLFSKKIQRGENIGDRMSNAFVDSIPPYKNVILIGGDIANITAAIIDNGFNKLNSHDFVLGPAHDGGYYLIGMKNPNPAIFKNIAWSTDKVASQTIKNIANLKKSYSLLPTLADIDTEEDWLKYGWEF